MHYARGSGRPTAYRISIPVINLIKLLAAVKLARYANTLTSDQGGPLGPGMFIQAQFLGRIPSEAAQISVNHPIDKQSLFQYMNESWRP